MAQTTLISKSQIDQRVAEMGAEISRDFAGTDLIALCVLKGAMFFCSDLMRQIAQSVRGASAELSEAARELSRYAARAGGDPQRLEEIDERLEVLRRLARKHGGTLASALQRREAMKAELSSLENHDEELARRVEEVGRLSAAARALAEKLSEKRRAAARGFSKAVATELLALGMKSDLDVLFSPAVEGAIGGLGPLPFERYLGGLAAARKGLSSCQ